MARRELVLTDDPAELTRVVAALEALAAEHRLGGPPLIDLIVAVDELVTNSLTHAAGAPAPVTVTLALEGTMLAAEVSDAGPPFDPLALATPSLASPLDERAVGGLGIHLARALADTIHYRHEDGRNHILVAKALQPLG